MRLRQWDLWGVYNMAQITSSTLYICSFAVNEQGRLRQISWESNHLFVTGAIFIFIFILVPPSYISRYPQNRRKLHKLQNLLKSIKTRNWIIAVTTKTWRWTKRAVIKILLPWTNQVLLLNHCIKSLPDKGVKKKWRQARWCFLFIFKKLWIVEFSVGTLSLPPPPLPQTE